MNTPSSTPQRSSVPIALAIVGTFLIIALLVWYVRARTQPPPLDQVRIAERSKALADLRAAEAEALNSPGWVDKEKGIVRLPITNAMDMVLRSWQNPAAAKSNLVQRVEKATFVPPPPPAAPSEFE